VIALGDIYGIIFFQGWQLLLPPAFHCHTLLHTYTQKGMDAFTKKGEKRKQSPKNCISSHSFGAVILWIGRSVLSTVRRWRSRRFCFLTFTSSEGSGGIRDAGADAQDSWALTVRCLVLLRREPLAVTNAESDQPILASLIGALALGRSVRSLGWLRRLVVACKMVDFLSYSSGSPCPRKVFLRPYTDIVRGVAQPLRSVGG
jgi:hypothetical protein